MLLERNTHNAYPQDVAEVGFAAERDDSENTNVAERRHVAGAVARRDASYEAAKGRLQAVCDDFRAELETPRTEHPSFIDGRTAAVVIDGEVVGVIGEVPPPCSSNTTWRCPSPPSSSTSTRCANTDSVVFSPTLCHDRVTRLGALAVSIGTTVRDVGNGCRSSAVSMRYLKGDERQRRQLITRTDLLHPLSLSTIAVPVPIATGPRCICSCVFQQGQQIEIRPDDQNRPGTRTYVSSIPNTPANSANSAIGTMAFRSRSPSRPVIPTTPQMAATFNTETMFPRPPPTF